jgi:hypothetical protein
MMSGKVRNGRELLKYWIPLDLLHYVGYSV